MGGGSYRQLSAARIAHAAVASKLSKLEDDVHAVVVERCGKARWRRPEVGRQ